MGQDPFYRDERQFERLVNDPQIITRLRIVWPRLATGFVALALLAAVWLTWRWG